MIFLGDAKELNDTEDFIFLLELSNKSEDLARVLFDSREDCYEFYIGFLGRNKNIIDDLLDYREKKLPLLFANTLEVSDYEINKASLERIFLQPLSTIESDFIIDSIQNGMTSFTEIYDKFKRFPNDNIMKHVL